MTDRRVGHRSTGRVRGLVVAALGLGLGAAGTWLVRSAWDGAAAVDTGQAIGTAAVDQLAGHLAAAAAGAVLVWWSAGLVAAVLTTRPGRLTSGRRVDRVARRLAGTLPRPVRALAGAALGAALVSGAAVPAVALDVPAASAVQVVAEEPTTVDPGWVATGDADLPAPGWTPQQPPRIRTATPADLVVEQPRASAVATAEVVVRSGDTLWDLCARHLPAGATDAEIAGEWPRWYMANRAVVGDDPHLLLPGQRLHPPTATYQP